jgi:hypothetical protein
MSTKRERLKARRDTEIAEKQKSYVVRFNSSENKSHTKSLAAILISLLVGVAAIAAIVVLVFG